MGRGARVGRIVATLVATLLLGCTEDASAPPPDDEMPSPHRVAVDTRALRPPGSQVTGSVVVQEGSHLVGTMFPLSPHAEDPDEDHWQAVFTVDGDPVEVWERYVKVLDGPETADARHSCTVTRIEPTLEVDPDEYRFQLQPLPPMRLLAEPRLGGENRLECRAYFEGTSMAMVVGLQSKVATALRCREGGQTLETCAASVAHLHVEAGETVRTWGAVPARTPAIELLGARAIHERIESGTPPPEDPYDPADLPLPSGPVVAPEFEVDGSLSRLPRAGEPFDDQLDNYLHDRGPLPASIIPDGAWSLMAPAVLIQCHSGTVAVLTVPGDPAAAVDAIDAAEPLDESSQRADGVDAGGRAWVARGISTAGGYLLDVLAVDTGGDRSTVLLRNCGD